MEDLELQIESLWSQWRTPKAIAKELGITLGEVNAYARRVGLLKYDKDITPNCTLHLCSRYHQYLPRTEFRRKYTSRTGRSLTCNDCAYRLSTGKVRSKPHVKTPKYQLPAVIERYYHPFFN